MFQGKIRAQLGRSEAGLLPANSAYKSTGEHGNHSFLWLDAVLRILKRALNSIILALKLTLDLFSGLNRHCSTRTLKRPFTTASGNFHGE